MLPFIINYLCREPEITVLTPLEPDVRILTTKGTHVTYCVVVVIQEAAAANAAGIRMYAVGVSNFVSDQFLSQVVFSPPQRNANYWTVNAYESLNGQVDNIVNSICTYSPLLPGIFAFLAFRYRKTYTW